VEDEYDSIQMVCKILTHHEVKVHVAHNGVECLELLHDIQPTVVVMDLAMPEMDGWNTLKHIRANPHTAHLPVVAITAYHSSAVADDATRAGFNAYFSKPINLKSFVSMLSQILE
jgi:CheY-like chemotaxis protein